MAAKVREDIRSMSGIERAAALARPPRHGQMVWLRPLSTWAQASSISVAARPPTSRVTGAPSSGAALSAPQSTRRPVMSTRNQDDPALPTCS